MALHAPTERRRTHHRPLAKTHHAPTERRPPRQVTRREVPASGLPLGAVTAVFVLGGIVLGPLRSVLVIGATSTFVMPVLASVGDWRAGVQPRQRGARLLNSVSIVVVAAVLTIVGEAVVGHVDLGGALQGTPVTDQHEFPTFPYLIPLAAIAFVSFLQLSIVSEGRLVFPDRFGPAAGRCAVVMCEVIAVVGSLLLANWNVVPPSMRAQIGLRNPGGPIPALDIATWLIVVSLWQTLYLVLDGWPYSLITRRPLRILVANVAVILLGSATYWLGRDAIGVTGPQLAAAAAMCIAGGLLVGPLLQIWSMKELTPGVTRAALAASSLMVATGLYVGLRAIGLGLSSGWTPGVPVELWMVICGLNLIGGGVLWYTRIVAADQALAST
jgi:hypothetical protein